MTTAQRWLRTLPLKLTIAATASIAALGGDRACRGPLGSAAKKKKCNETSRGQAV